MRDFDLNTIYKNPRIKTQSKKIRRMYKFMFETFLDDLDQKNLNSNIYQHHMNYYQDSGYSESYSKPEIVRDYIAGMTDNYFNNTFKETFLPRKCRYTVEECENRDRSKVFDYSIFRHI